MNMKKLLTIILSVLVVLLIGGTVATVVLWPTLTGANSAGYGTVINGSEEDKYNGYADVTLYGAVANDGKDDTSAFMKAAKTGAGVYVPAGTFDIKKTVVLNGQTLKGASIELSIIRFNGKGTIVEMKGITAVNDITLSFAEKYITGNEKQGEQVAIADNGILSGTKISGVKATNVGTGYYSDKKSASNASLLAESLLVDNFTYKAVEIKDATSTTFRALNVGKALNKVNCAVSLGGSFTLDAVSFTGTKADYLLELNNCRAAAVNSLLFEGVTAEKGSLIKSNSSVMSIKTVTVVNSSAKTLVKIEDKNDSVQSTGDIVMLWSDSQLTVDSDGIIKCTNNISQ